MKKSLLIPLLLLTLSACSTNDKKEIADTKKTTAISTTAGTSEEKNWLSVNGASPTYKQGKIIELTGTAKPNTDITISLESDRKEIVKSTANDKGDFKVSFDAPVSSDSYLFKNEEEKMFIVLYSEKDFAKKKEVARLEKEMAEKEKENKEKIEREMKNKEAEEKRKAEEKQKKENEKTTEDSSAESNLLDYQKEGIENSKSYPASSGKILFDNSKNQFKGMNYYFEGEIIGNVKLKNVTDGKAWLVKNSEGYVMPIEHNYFEATDGDKVKVWGTLSGLKFSNSDLKVDNVVGATGSMHAMSVEVNGETQY